MPRARCFCGNPLLPPVPAKKQVVYTGAAWPDFNPGAVGVVSPAPQPVTQFTVRIENTFAGHVFEFENASASWRWTLPDGGIRDPHRICG